MKTLPGSPVGLWNGRQRRFYRVLTENGNQITHREGIEISVKKILVKDFEHEPNLALAPRDVFTTSFDEIVNDPSIDIVVECMGGIEPARSFILKALKAGKTVVTSNKEVMSKHWPAFEQAAKSTGAGLYLEATVAAAAFRFCAQFSTPCRPTTSHA